MWESGKFHRVSRFHLFSAVLDALSKLPEVGTFSFEQILLVTEKK